MSSVSAAAFYEAVQKEANTVLIGNAEVVERLTIALLTNGHVLLEGVPGVAKTTIANVFARTSGLEVKRIQMTPDMVPADITGTSVYRAQTGEFERREGPIFSNVVIADEINRSTPKTQSALLEAMQEGEVSIDGETLSLPSPFFVVATQNPIEMEGTFELPEAQRDRFQQKLVVDLPSSDIEHQLLDRVDQRSELRADQANVAVTQADLKTARKAVEQVFVADKIKEYILQIVAETRTTEELEYGGSPRASIAFLRAAKARAAIHDRDYVLPDDIKALAPSILQHRLILSTESELSGRSVQDIIQSILDSVPLPENIATNSH
ncbi:MoxR family ATPase [Haloprofundus sp. MHR1]|uniref:AAA family ATPase n=1 Tax=Haloprofundus sp. MHR1 TaxID=2572921 RepID=UPI0010BEA81E|nr:MoxR family ATPase [Haloprofundus sp. MHR1]QCJ46000.1 MoxR family ATPase [Haloprofundus sp. MHR1]